MIEPRYARAHVWLAVAEYTLGGQGAALDSLERARQADPKDPLAWQVESMIRNDAGEPEQIKALVMTGSRLKPPPDCQN